MIEKLDDADYQNADSILEVNSKTGEFLVKLYNKYGKDVAEKVKIVASSEITKQFIKRILALLDLPEYNLLDITVKDFIETKTLDNMKFDICLMNPPYNGTRHLKFLDKCLQLSNIVVSIQPSIFLFGKNKESKSKENINSIITIIDTFGAVIENIDGTEIFDSAPPQDLAIISIDKTTQDSIHLINYGSKESIVASSKDIKKYGNDNDLLALDNKLKKLYEHDNFWNHIVCGPRAHGHLGKKENNKKIDYNPNPNSIIVPLTATHGHRAGNDDFFTAVPSDLKPVLYKDYKEGKNTPWFYIVCDNYEYANNLVDYLKSDFVRACLFFTKTSIILELNYIPWIDFNNSCKDKDLYKRFNINKKEQQLIEDNLPDYYGIR